MRSAAIVAALTLLIPFHVALAQRVDDPAPIQTDWLKTCWTAGIRHTCLTGKHARRQDRTLVASIQLIDVDRDPKNILRVTFPLGVQLIPGTRLIIDQDQPASAPYTNCNVGGCFADYDVDANVIAKLKSGTQIAAQAIRRDGQPVSILFSLKDFAAILDGPPTQASASAEPQDISQPRRWLDDTLQPHLRPKIR